MRKNVFHWILTSLAIFVVSGVQAQEKFPNFQIGLQTSFPIGGLSAKVNVTENHTGQAVVGVFGPVSSYYGRYLYHFNSDKTESSLACKPYLYGQAGYYVYDLGSNYYWEDDKESNFGYGLGGGIELHFKELLKNLKFSVELGYNKVDFDYYEFKTIAFGVGMHYQLNF